MRKYKHKIESRKREISESYCAQAGCKFRGKPAQQGICHTVEEWVVPFAAMDRYVENHRKETAEIRKTYKGKEYVRWLEAMYETTSLNSATLIDDLVRLRKENALLKLKLEKKR